MSKKDDEFLESLQATFKDEAEEQLQAIATGLLELEKTPAPEDPFRLVETVFRAAHSLKGAARAVNFTEIEALCESMEDVFSAWKRHQSAPTPQVLDRLHRTLDEITRMMALPAGSQSVFGQTPLSPIVHSLARLELSGAPVPVSEPDRGRTTVPSGAIPTPAPGASEKAVFGETVRIAVAKLDTRLSDAEEMLATKLSAGQRASDLRELADGVEEWKNEWARVQPEVQLLRRWFERPSPAGRTAPPSDPRRLVEFFDWNHDYLRSLENKIATFRHTAEQDRLAVGKLVDDLLEDSKNLLMVPLATLGALFPKVVRDLCRDQGKEADLAIHGEEVEIDKRILEEMKDPLIHLLRNCVDHGVETPAERGRRGKPMRATLTLAVSRVNGNQVEILVSDDGAGIDVEKVKESALKHGFITPAQARQLSESDALELVFETDVSTSPLITQVSGRGLGMAIVREKAEKLGGRVSVESRRHAGTSIQITLPVTLATFRGILVEVAQRLFVVPTTQVERVVRFKPEDIQTVEGRETLSLNQHTVVLARLADVLGLPPARLNGDPAASTPAVILGTRDQRVAFAVDAVLDEQEVLVKRLGKPLSRVRNIAGATILGSGRLVPILNVADLLKSAKKAGGAPRRMPAEKKPAEGEVRSVLVVEDSITSRMLLKSILETAGYQVRTAVDGREAFATLRTESFDLVVSDVEMPRMDGFDLTAKIRADRKLANLPVVLVTAMESREDRERGIDVGANAYLVKSSFDQSDLLEVVRRLL